MPTAWRVMAEKYTLPPHSPFDGKGAAKDGGRWNSPGVAVAYLSGHVSLALLEVLVHAGSINRLAGSVVIGVSFDDDDVTEIPLVTLPSNWREFEAENTLRLIGDEWYKKLSTPLLRVPSAVLPLEHNYLFNPIHQRAGTILATITPATLLPPLDPRLTAI
jgi:RES domain-containing protein